MIRWVGHGHLPAPCGQRSKPSPRLALQPPARTITIDRARGSSRRSPVMPMRRGRPVRMAYTLEPEMGTMDRRDGTAERRYAAAAAGEASGGA